MQLKEKNKLYNIQIVEFENNQKYVTKRTDSRTIEQINACKDHGLYQARKGKTISLVLRLLLGGVKCVNVINPRDLQGIPEPKAKVHQLRIIQGLRSMNGEEMVLNKSGRSD